MTSTAPQISPNGSRLVRFLTELEVSDVPVSHKYFTQRLGELFDLNDSITLSDMHSQLARLSFEEPTGNVREIKTDFLVARTGIIEAAINSFIVGKQSSRLSFPLHADEPPEDIKGASDACVRFYSAQQREVDYRIRELQQWVRDAVSGLSLKLARLAQLDATLHETLAPRARRYFSSVSGLLGKRATLLLQTYQNSLSDGENNQQLWAKTADTLRIECRGLLLAEIEARLLPVMGLIEAMDEHINETTL
jgi:Protein of unknown function (DUF3348)